MRTEKVLKELRTLRNLLKYYEWEELSEEDIEIINKYIGKLTPEEYEENRERNLEELEEEFNVEWNEWLDQYEYLDYEEEPDYYAIEKEREMVGKYNETI